MWLTFYFDFIVCFDNIYGRIHCNLPMKYNKMEKKGIY